MMEPGCSGSYKRKIKDIDDESVTNDKKICVNTSDNALYYQETQGLMRLPDDVLYIILSNLHPRDRLQISLTCQRMFNLVGTPFLWRDVDCRPFHIDHSSFKRVIKFLSITTVSLSISGCENIESNDLQLTCSRRSLKKIKQKCTNLKILRLEEDRLCKIKIEDLPQALEELSLAGSCCCNFTDESPFFFQVNKFLPNLTKLCLRGCRQFDPKALVILSNISNLRNLDLSECTSIGDCTPYFRAAAMYGFKKLQILDLRQSLVGDAEVASLRLLPCLTDLLLQSPVRHNRPIQGVRFMRHLNIMHINRNGARLELGAFPADDDNENIHENDENVNEDLPFDQPDGREQEANRPHQEAGEEGEEGEEDEEGEEVEEDREGEENRGVDDREGVEDRGVEGDEEGEEHVDPFLNMPIPACRLITDRAICVFGLRRFGLQGEKSESLLKRLTLRNYILITNDTLHHLTHATPHLRYLDVCGTRVTRNGVEDFKHVRPDCIIVSDFD